MGMAARRRGDKIAEAEQGAIFAAFPKKYSSGPTWRRGSETIQRMRFLPIVLLLAASLVGAQGNHGELHVEVTDPSGAAVRAEVELRSAGTGYDQELQCDSRGSLTIRMIPYGAYQLRVREAGFSTFAESLEIRSAVPEQEHIRLTIASAHTDITVSADGTMMDAGSASSGIQIGSREIEERDSSLPGRSVQDLIVSQPGWLYEGNAVLHPRGSEYQTQFVVDGIPLTENRSPGLGPEIEADDVESVSIYTAGFPAEYGRKLGGVVELNTRRQTDAGLHGAAVLWGGSYDTAGGYAEAQETKGKDTAGITASGAGTSHFLNPVVPENYTNTGTTGDFSAHLERDLKQSDRVEVSLRRDFTRFLIPNELVQQQAGQIQNGDNLETMGVGSYQHIASPDSLFAVSGMGRRESNDLESNRNPTPIAAFQHNHFDEGYVKATYALHLRRHEIKAGIESDATFLHEQFNYTITDATQFDPGTPPALSFAAQRPDLEQAAFAEDTAHFGPWNVSAGLRWDHYQLLLNRQAFSPRLSVSRWTPKANMMVHASYDRIFQTPSFENLLLSSSAQVEALSSEFLRLPVQPSLGSYYEGGVSKGFDGHARLDINVYRRDARNFADDDQLLNTGISYPIAFDKGVIYGAEGKLQVTQAGRLSGFASYSYMVGNVWLPVTGGLFLGDDAANALAQLQGHFPDSQDQRNTLASRWDYRLGSRVTMSAGAAYGSGLPFDFGGTEAQALAEYGAEVVSRLNFARGRILPSLAMSSSVAVDVYKHDHVETTLRIDGENLNGRLNVLDFGGLFSGNAIAPGRSMMLRLTSRF